MFLEHTGKVACKLGAIIHVDFLRRSGGAGLACNCLIPACIAQYTLKSLGDFCRLHRLGEPCVHKTIENIDAS